MEPKRRSHEVARLSLAIQQGFGRILREHRLALEMTQDDLAAKCGIDRTYVSLLERGKRQPTVTVLIQIASALSIAPEELLREIAAAVTAPKRRSR